MNDTTNKWHDRNKMNGYIWEVGEDEVLVSSDMMDRTHTPFIYEKEILICLHTQSKPSFDKSTVIK